MKNANQLFIEFLSLVNRPEDVAKLFAEDGALGIPYLADLGMPPRYVGRGEIAGLYKQLLVLVPTWKFRDVTTHIETEDKLFAEYWVDEPTAGTNRRFRQHFFGYLKAENGKIKLLREALNQVTTARSFFPNGLADIPKSKA